MKLPTFTAIEHFLIKSAALLLLIVMLIRLVAHEILPLLK